MRRIVAGGAAASDLGFEVHCEVESLMLEQSVRLQRCGQARYSSFLSELSLLEVVWHLFLVRLQMRLWKDREMGMESQWEVLVCDGQGESRVLPEEQFVTELS